MVRPPERGPPIGVDEAVRSRGLRGLSPSAVESSSSSSESESAATALPAQVQTTLKRESAASLPLLCEFTQPGLPQIAPKPFCWHAGIKDVCHSGVQHMHRCPFSWA